MKRLDFISGAPKTFIFQRDTNKTNLGGLFTIIFFLIIIIITHSYLYEYFANPKYKITYTYDEKYYQDEELSEIYSNRLLYPEITYSLNVSHPIRKHLLVLDEHAKELTFEEEYKRAVSDLKFFIFYKCKNSSNCELRDKDEDGEADYNHTNIINLYDLLITYKGYYCDHQNPDSPIKREKDYEEFPFSITDHIDYYRFNWKIIKYEEETSISGMLKNTYEYYGGEFTRPNKFSIPSNKYWFIKIINSKGKTEYYKMVAAFVFWQNNFGYYDLYSRDRISILDPLANTCSLIMTLYGVLTFIFCGFYSNSFDNYKIIEKILTNKSTLETQKREKVIELGDKANSDSDNKEANLLEKSDKDDVIILDVKDNNNIVKAQSVDDKLNIKLPKFHFYDFFYNNIYNEKYCVSPSQEIISTCNDIICKYYSIETVIYNQLRLENLFKDYKWNNPELNTLGNNNLINKIRNLSGS